MNNEKKVIDSHVHLDTLFDENGKDYFERLDSLIQQTGIDRICLNALGDKVYGGADNIIMSALYKLHNPSTFATSSFVYPQYPVSTPLPEGLDILTQYRELMEIGFDGIKILYKPTVQKEIGLPINHEIYEEMFAQAEKDHTYFLWHLADPAFFWSNEYTGHHSYKDGTYLSFRQMFTDTFDVLDRHPGLNVVFAHFLFLSEHPDVLEDIFERYKNVSIDVTPGTEMYDVFTANLDFYRSFFEKHADRLLFGTDSTPCFDGSKDLTLAVYRAMTTDEEVEIWKHTAKGLRLSKSACEKILYQNFLRKCRQSPKPINIKALKNYIEKYTPLITNEEHKQQILKAATVLP